MKKILFIALIIIFQNGYIYSQNDYFVTADNKSENANKKDLSKEDLFIKNNFPFIDMADWEKGMKFMITTPQTSFASLNIRPYESNQRNISQTKYAGEIFILENKEERNVNCPRGVCTRTYIVFSNDKEKYEYEFIGNLEEMRQSKAFKEIYGLAYLDDIDKAKSILIDKTLYIMTNDWLDESNSSAAGKKKYVPVKITKIGIGTSDKPVKMIFKGIDDDAEFFRDVVFSGINSKNKLVSDSRFQTLFCFEDPRLKYPMISDSNWALIQQSKVVPGMTELECILSWGKPEKKNSTTRDSGVFEQWVYLAGAYLYFDKGKLVSIQE